LTNNIVELAESLGAPSLSQSLKDWWLCSTETPAEQEKALTALLFFIAWHLWNRRKSLRKGHHSHPKIIDICKESFHSWGATGACDLIFPWLSSRSLCLVVSVVISVVLILVAVFFPCRLGWSVRT
jgi:hypothetical protein